MVIILKSPLLLQFISLTVLLTCSGLVFAAPSSGQFDNFYPNCDIRQLGLSQDQQNALRKIRSDYKTAANKATRKAQYADRTRRQNIIKILSNPSFDQNLARDYVENRYLSRMDFAVDELAIQHRFYHLLNPQQRQLWLRNCLR